jgi:hypothetical protein
MGRRLPGLTAFLLLLALAHGARAAAPPALTVTGDHTATAEITLTARTTLDFDDALVSTQGRYALLTVYSAGRMAGGVARLPELADPAQPDPLAPPSVLGNGTVTLDPGRYRVYLMTDAATTVAVPLLAGDGLTVTPTGALHATYGATRTPVTSSSAAARVPVASRRHAVTLLVAQYGAGTVNLDPQTLRLCFTPRGHTCTHGMTVNARTMRTMQFGFQTTETLRNGTDGRAEVRTTPTAPPPAPSDTLGLVVLQHDLLR